MNDFEYSEDKYDYIIPLDNNKSCVKYQSEHGILEFHVFMPKENKTSVYFFSATDKEFSRVCSYLGMGTSHRDLLKLLFKLGIIESNTLFELGIEEP